MHAAVIMLASLQAWCFTWPAETAGQVPCIRLDGVPAPGIVLWSEPATPGLHQARRTSISGTAIAKANARADTAMAAPRITPRGALLRSLVVPGWGQVRLGHPLKAMLFAGTAAGLVTGTVATQRQLNRVDSQLDALRRQTPNSQLVPALRRKRQDRVARRNTCVLYVMLAAAAAGLDAYVDAQLADFGPEDAQLSFRATPHVAVIMLSRRW